MFIYLFVYLINVFEYFACVCLVPEEAERGRQSPPELELQMIVNCHVTAGH